MKKISWSDIAKLDMEELVKAQAWATEELERRAEIEAKVKRINELLHDLAGDLRGVDSLDIMNSRTGEILHQFDDDYIGDEPGDWASPEIIVIFNGKGE